MFIRRLATLTLILGLGYATAGISTASAAAPATSSSVVITAKRAPVSPGTVTPQVSSQTITCTILSNRPHWSGHVPGTINSEVTVTCTAPVARIVGVLSLYKNNAYVSGSGGSMDRYGTNSGIIYAPAVNGCGPGTYHSAGIVSIYWPAGFTPATSLNNQTRSADVYFSCD